jgi:guanylate kinase
MILLVGKSGAGKDYYCEQHNLRRVVSHTTRKPRTGEINGVHKWFSTYDECLANWRRIVAYTQFSGARYWAYPEDLVDKDVYVIDPAGVRFFRRFSPKLDIPITVILITAPWYVRLKRMVTRGDGVLSALRRIIHDHFEFKNLKPDQVIRNY